MDWFGKFFGGLLGRRDDGQSAARKGRKSVAFSPVNLQASGAGVARASRRRGGMPKFQLTAGDRLDPDITNEFTRARASLRAVYTPSQPITDPRMFAGRNEVLTTLIRAIEDQRQHVVLYGERGIGKTSLLHILSDAARAARYLTVYISCGAASNFEEMVRALAEGIPLLYHREHGPRSVEGERGGTFAELIAPGPISARTASDLLAKVDGTRVLVLLDEFDRVDASSFRQAVAELIKDLSDRSSRVQLVIAGVASNLTELLEYIPSIQRNIIAVQVPRMTPEEVVDLVKVGEEPTGITFEPAAVRFVGAAANGFPFLASLLTQHAALSALEASRLTVTEDDVSAAVAGALGEFKARISVRAQAHIRQVVKEHADQLIGMLAGIALSRNGEFTTENIPTIGADGSVANQDVIERLAQGRILIEAHEGELGAVYRFCEEGVASYLWLMYAQNRYLDEPATDGAQPSLTFS